MIVLGRFPGSLSSSSPGGRELHGLREGQGREDDRLEEEVGSPGGRWNEIGGIGGMGDWGDWISLPTCPNRCQSLTPQTDNVSLGALEHLQCVLGKREA